MGAVTPIEGTPWAAWVDLPESLIMAPARTFLRRMIIIAFIAVSLAGIAVTLLSAHITRPLTALTEASASIAAGNYASHVTIEGRDEVGRLGEVFNAMADRVAAGRRELEDRVQQRTARLEETTGLLEKRVSELQQVRTDLEAQANELAVVNQELEAFSYSVSHDLRAPLRHVTGFAALLDSSAQHKLSPEERRHLTTIVSAAGRMGRLIDDLLSFSRTGRRPIDKRKVRLDDLVTAARHELNMEAHIDRVEWAIGPLPEVDGDYGLLELVMVNLVGNALKYTRHQPQPRIEIGARTTNPREVVVYVKDNGAGFDMQYVDRLFGVFQRLHTEDEFEGTGIGLASVRRIIHRHGGRTWAEGAVNQGATFYFSLPR
jgi:light-regulated signal transduction histidine kinase (bacteriophytochrome)/HAMP domain-containing protein